MPRLSVILPVRNGESTIDRAVRSTLQAMGTDSELVVLDDGSTDGTRAVLDEISDPRLRILESNRPDGVAAGLNLLLAATDSEFVGRMDADDVTLPGRFPSQLRALDRGADAVFTTVLEWRADRRRIRPAAPAQIGVAAFPFHLLLTNPVSHPTLVARRSALDAVGGYRRVPAEDYDLWLRLAVHGARLRRLAVPRLLYRIHPSQVTASLDWRHASWTDPDVAAAFGALSTQLLGTPFPRLTTLGHTANDAASLEAALAAFSEAYRRSVARLSVGERAILLRKLRERVAAVRRMPLASGA